MKILLWKIVVFSLAMQAVTCLAGEHGGRLAMEFDLSGHESSKEARLWVPYPVSDPYQHITNISITGDFSESAVYTDQEFQNPVLYARWAAGTSKRTLTFSFDVVRQERLQRDLPEKEGAWDLADYARYLQPTRLGPIDGVVKAKAEEIVAGRTTVLGKARAIYDWICSSMYRDPATRGCGPGDVCKLLAEPGGKCADIHSVFVALARSVGVPAREIFGMRQGKKGVTDVTTWQHCWAEFFLPGYGWLVVDPVDVRKMMLTEKLGDNDIMTYGYRAYFFGGIDPYRLRLSTGRDLRLTPPQQGAPLNYLMYPFAQIGATTLDWLAPQSFKYTITHTSN